MRNVRKSTTRGRVPQNAGFTMVEMVVSVGLFTTLMLIIVGSFLSVTDAARKARSTRIALDNVSASMDYMAREIRLGSYFRCENDTTMDTADTPGFPLPCPYSGTGGILLGFERAGQSLATMNDQTVFRFFDPDGAGPLNGRIQRSLNCCDGATTYEDLTAPELNITHFRFYVDGTNHAVVTPANADQPRITMVVRGVAGGNKVKTTVPFSLQTTLSARTPNIPPP